MDHNIHDLAGAAYNTGAGQLPTISNGVAHLDYSREETIRGCTEFTHQQDTDRSIVTYRIYNEATASPTALIHEGTIDITGTSGIDAGRAISAAVWEHLGSPLQAEAELKWADTPSMTALRDMTNELRDAGQSVQARMSTLNADAVESEVVVTSTVPSLTAADVDIIERKATFLSDREADRVNVSVTDSDPAGMPYEDDMDANQFTEFVKNRVLVTNNAESINASTANESADLDQHAVAVDNPLNPLFPHSVTDNLAATANGTTTPDEPTYTTSPAAEVDNGPDV